jgi:hypothetical protein
LAYYRWRNRYGNLESDLAEHLTELETEIARLRRVASDLTLDKLILVEATTGAQSPELRAAYVMHAGAMWGISERRACRALGQHRSTQRKIRERLSLEKPSAGHQRHSANMQLLSTGLSDRRSTPRDRALRAGVDPARGEGVDIDPDFTNSTGEMTLIG